MSTAPLYLTIDIDWAHDAVIADTLALVAARGFPGEFPDRSVQIRPPSGMVPHRPTAQRPGQ